MNVWGDECLKIGRGWWMAEVMNVGVMNVGQSKYICIHIGHALYIHYIWYILNAKTKIEASWLNQRLNQVTPQKNFFLLGIHISIGKLKYGYIHICTYPYFNLPIQLGLQPPWNNKYLCLAHYNHETINTNLQNHSLKGHLCFIFLPEQVLKHFKVLRQLKYGWSKNPILHKVWCRLFMRPLNLLNAQA